MFASDHYTIPSPDGRFEALLKVVGRTAWQLTRSRLMVAGLSFRERAFDWQGVWSPCSRYFAIMEWRHENVLSIPAAQLVVLDLQERRECVIDRVDSGFVEPLRLSDGRVRYVRIDLRDHSPRRVLEQPLDPAGAWTALAGTRQNAA